jgi:ribosomal-protein-alanine N-acetyltransferase
MSGAGKLEGEAAAPAQKKEPALPEKEKNHVTAIAAVSPPVPVLTVTQATHVDIPDICGLYKKVWDEVRGKVPQELEQTWQPNPLEFTSMMEGMTYFAARKDRKLVGVVCCSMVEGAMYISHIAVDPEFRRQGVGQALVGQCLEWAKRSNAASGWIESISRFHPAISLFKKLGFKESGVIHKHLWKEDVTLLEIVF